MKHIPRKWHAQRDTVSILWNDPGFPLSPVLPTYLATRNQASNALVLAQLGFYRVGDNCLTALASLGLGGSRGLGLLGRALGLLLLGLGFLGLLLLGLSLAVALLHLAG